jgi:putative spermidine/putrescine transport system substrate-binding protein
MKMAIWRSLIAGSLFAAISATAWAAEVTITISGSGGTLTDVQKAIYQDPFSAKTGIGVNNIATTNRVSALKAMKMTGKAQWDVTELSGPEYQQAVNAGYLEAVDWSLVDPQNKLPAIARPKYGLAAGSYSTILGVRTDKLPAGKQMTSWKDFWDVKTFPGPRALQKGALDNLEFALLADGVAKEDVYKVLLADGGIDRAFKKLDEIKPYITAWWTTGAQPVQMLANGEVFYTSAWNGRITKLAEDGVPAAIVWNGGSLKPSYQCVPVGAPHPKEAMQYLAFLISDPKMNADFAIKMPYPGFVPGIYDNMPEAAAKTMPTYPANAAVQFESDNSFWVDRRAPLDERFAAWLLK